MNKYFKWGIIAASITLVLGGAAISIWILNKPNNIDAQVKKRNPNLCRSKISSTRYR